MKKEEITPEQKEEFRELALKNLGGTIWKYATPKLVTSEQYGQLSEIAKGTYAETISERPEQDIYEKLFLPQLAEEGGAITSPYLQKMSLKIIQESIQMLKVEDIYNFIGLETAMKEDYAGKYVFELTKEEVGNLVGSYMSFRTSDIVKGLLDKNKEGIKKNLEGILCESKEQEKQTA